MTVVSTNPNGYNSRNVNERIKERNRNPMEITYLPRMLILRQCKMVSKNLDKPRYTLMETDS